MTVRENLAIVLSNKNIPSEFFTQFIDCPYFCNLDGDCLNEGTGLMYGTAAYKANCRKCKTDWLNRECNSESIFSGE